MMNVGTKLKVLGKCESQEKVLSFIVYRELVDVKLFNLYNVQQLLWCEKKLVKKNVFFIYAHFSASMVVVRQRQLRLINRLFICLNFDSFER